MDSDAPYADSLLCLLWKKGSSAPSGVVAAGPGEGSAAPCSDLHHAYGRQTVGYRNAGDVCSGHVGISERGGLTAASAVANKEVPR